VVSPRRRRGIEVREGSLDYGNRFGRYIGVLCLGVLIQGMMEGSTSLEHLLLDYAEGRLCAWNHNRWNILIHPVVGRKRLKAMKWDLNLSDDLRVSGDHRNQNPNIGSKLTTGVHLCVSVMRRGRPGGRFPIYVSGCIV
jgi:hypothetical protein